MSLHFLSFITGFAADLLFGDPLGSFHIVVAIGKLISALEKLLRRLLPKSPGGERAGGIITVILVCVLSFGCAGAVLGAAYGVHWLLGFVLESFVCWQCLAARSLQKESMAVYRAAKSGSLEKARKAVGRIVGRDTAGLDMSGVSRACVETVAENCSDGVIAPLLFMAVGGAPGAVLYKAINTMDSMLGYKNERYIHFGWAAAKLDDGANFIPARIAGLLMIAAAALCGMDARGAWRIFRRDRLNHASPNSAQTESACAGALHIRLGGPAQYFGKMLDKPYIGDDERSVETEDIRRANRLMITSGLLCFAICLLVKGVAVIC